MASLCRSTADGSADDVELTVEALAPQRIVPVIVTEGPQNAKPLAEALAAGGIHAVLARIHRTASSG